MAFGRLFLSISQRAHRLSKAQTIDNGTLPAVHHVAAKQARSQSVHRCLAHCKELDSSSLKPRGIIRRHCWFCMALPAKPSDEGAPGGAVVAAVASRPPGSVVATADGGLAPWLVLGTAASPGPAAAAMPDADGRAAVSSTRSLFSSAADPAAGDAAASGRGLLPSRLPESEGC